MNREFQKLHALEKKAAKLQMQLWELEKQWEAQRAIIANVMPNKWILHCHNQGLAVDYSFRDSYAC